MEEHTASQPDVGLSLTPAQIMGFLRARMRGETPAPTAAEKQADRDRRFPVVVITGETRFAYRLSQPGSERDVWISKQGVTLHDRMETLPHEKRKDKPDGKRVWYPTTRACFAPWARAKFLANT